MVLKTKIGFILLIAFVFSLAACDKNELVPSEYDEVNSLEGFRVTSLEDSITTTGMTLRYENSTDSEITYGQSFVLEKEENGNWFRVPTIIEDYGFEDIGYIVSPQSTAEETIDWKWLYGEISPGEYRIIKEFLIVEEPGDYETYPIAVEFEISN